MNSLKILVIDDNQAHIAAAKLQLEGHDVVYVESFDMAKAILGARMCDLDQVAVFGEQPEGMGWKEWNIGCKQKLAELSNTKFDVILTDLMLPASAIRLSNPQEYVGKLMPLGMFIVMLALKAGVKMVGLLTDTNHHAHPASAAIDMFEKSMMQLGEARVILSNFAYQITGKDKKYCWYKDWKSLLEQLTGEVLSEEERYQRAKKWFPLDLRVQ